MSGITNPRRKTCYCSSAVQMLAACDRVFSYFSTHEFRHSKNAPASECKSCVTCIMAIALRYIREKHTKPLTFKTLLPILEELQYNPTEKQDSREFLFNFINYCAPEIRDYFAISTTKVLHCKNNDCSRHDYLGSEDIVMISLAGKIYGVQHAVDSYFKENKLEGMACPKCEKLNTSFVLKNVRKSNNIIFVHNVNAAEIKIDRILVFELKTYYLIAFNIAKGFSEEDRHYTCVRRLSGDGLWYEFDDSHVRKYDMDLVNHYESAYLMMYVTITELPGRLGRVTASTPIFPSPEFEDMIIPEDTIHPKLLRKRPEPSAACGVAPPSNPDDDPPPTNSENEKKDKDDSTVVASTDKEKDQTVDDKEKDATLEEKSSATDIPQKKTHETDQELTEQENENPVLQDVTLPVPTEDKEDDIENDGDDLNSSRTIDYWSVDDTGVVYRGFMDEEGNQQHYEVRLAEMVKVEVDENWYKNNPVPIGDPIKSQDMIDMSSLQSDQMYNFGEYFTYPEDPKLRQKPMIPLSSAPVDNYLRKQSEHQTPKKTLRKRKATDDTSPDGKTERKRRKTDTAKKPTSGKESKRKPDDSDKKPRSGKDSKKRQQDSDKQPAPGTKKMSIVELRYRRKQEAKKGAKRKYEYREWDVSGLNEKDPYSTPHKSMIKRKGSQVLPRNQGSTGFCVLCGGKKRFYTQAAGQMAEHYKMKHYKRVFKIKTHLHLLCKCSDVQSRKENTDRNGHHHCPICWTPLEKSTDVAKHIITEHDFDDCEIERREINF